MKSSKGRCVQKLLKWEHVKIGRSQRWFLFLWRFALIKKSNFSQFGVRNVLICFLWALTNLIIDLQPPLDSAGVKVVFGWSRWLLRITSWTPKPISIPRRQGEWLLAQRCYGYNYFQLLFPAENNPKDFHECWEFSYPLTRFTWIHPLFSEPETVWFRTRHKNQAIANMNDRLRERKIDFQDLKVYGKKWDEMGI